MVVRVGKSKLLVFCPTNFDAPGTKLISLLQLGTKGLVVLSVAMESVEKHISLVYSGLSSKPLSLTFHLQDHHDFGCKY